MKILRAEHLGMCFGVRDAIQLAHRKITEGPLTILGELVHNEKVIGSLRERGVAMADTPDQIGRSTVMITAHGASAKRIDSVRRQGLNVIEATCPLVRLAHGALARLVRDGYYPVIVGKRDHVEVRGMTEDLQEYAVILADADVREVPRRDRFGVIAQTTQPIERVRHLAGLLRQQYPAAEVRFVDTVCQPTKQRQNAATELAQQSDVVVVIGGRRSNNTLELVQTCQRACPRVHHVQTAADLRREWFQAADRVGITAGTSTPDDVIDAVEGRLVSWAVPAVDEVESPGTEHREQVHAIQPL